MVTGIYLWVKLCSNFDVSRRGPEEPVVFESLIDWTTSSDERIQHYSGTAFYYNTFNLNNLEKGEKTTIDLMTGLSKRNLLNFHFFLDEKMRNPSNPYKLFQKRKN